MGRWETSVHEGEEKGNVGGEKNGGVGGKGAL